MCLYMYIGSNAGIVVRKVWEKVGCCTQQKGIVFLKSIFVIVKGSFDSCFETIFCLVFKMLHVEETLKAFPRLGSFSIVKPREH